jgi:hypothetical protein
MTGLTDSLEHIIELLLSGHKQDNTIVVGELNAKVFHVTYDKRIRRILCLCPMVTGKEDR